MKKEAIAGDKVNLRALYFYERIGFKKEGIQEQGCFYDGSFRDLVMLRILKREDHFIQ